MACSSQSAVEYVRRARTNLVRTLKGLTTVIVENLYQRGVFSEEEVSKINTERDDFDKNRGIVDTVIKGGEAACYEFLRIIDITRKRSTERPPSFLENTDSNSSSRDKFDLSYWISCFSFKEDTNMDVTYLQGPSPCHRYQQKLKSKAQKISERSWTQSKAVLFNKETSLSYSSLVLDTQGQASASKIKKSKIKKSRKVRTKKLKAHIPEDKQETSPSELLKTYERKILLVGKPGIGKTAVVHQMLKLWSEKDNKDIDYMFYFDMRETPNITEVHKLKDLLFCKFSEPDEGKDKVLEDLKNNADSVTIIFDGVADVPSSSTQSVVLELIQKTLLPEAKIIITCRPEVESADFLLDWDCLRVEVKGFSEQGIREYLSKNLSEEHFSKVLCNLELFSLCHVPMYALMVVACFSFEGTVFCPHPCTVTEIYLNILHFCNQRNVGKTSENEAVQCNAILSLAEAAFYATKGKNVNLTSLTQIDRCANLGFMNKLLIQAGPVQKKPLCAFLHYTIQEVFAALWLLKDPERIRSVVQQCLTDDIKHMKHLVPFLCGLLNEKNMDLLQFLFTSQHLRETSGWFFKHLVTTFVDCSDTEDCEIDLLFLCQCLYESQSAEACVYLLDKLDYSLDLSGETLNPQQCYAVSYIISQSKERKIQLNLEDTTVSKQGVRPLLGCLSKLQRTDFLSWQLWTICLLSEVEVDYISLLCFAENQLHLSVNSQTQLYDRAGKVLQKSAEKVKVCLHWDHRSSVYQSVSKFLLLCLPNIHSLSFFQSSKNLSDQNKFLMNLIIGAAEREQQTGEKILQLLSSVCRYKNSPLTEKWCDFLMDLYSYETKTGLSVLPSLQSVFQSAPAVWSINLSERKTSILLEVLRLQPEKKQVELTGCSHEESEVRSFLQCLPYISQLSVDTKTSDEDRTKFFVNLFCAAAEREQQTGEKILELLSSVCTYQTFPFNERCKDDDDDHDMKKRQCDLLLDLYSKVKDCEAKTGLSVLPSLQSVFQSAPAVWFINLSERKTSILLEVLKLQPEKKQVELTQYTHKKSKIRSFLQCLPYISQLSVYFEDPDEEIRFFVNLFCAAAEREQQTGETILELLSSVCTYQTFPVNEKDMDDDNDDDDDDMKKRQCDHLLDLYSKVKDCETKTGLSVLPSLQSVFQSAPAVWSINLSERTTSILLEVLKLQPEKKQVELTQYTHKKSKIRSFLQCLPYISQLSVDSLGPRLHEAVRFFVNLFCAAAEREQQTGEKILELLSSVCTYQTFPYGNINLSDYGKKCQSDFLLDLYSKVKDCEAKTGLSVLPSLQSVFQSAPAVWFINLSERTTSILLEVLKLQPEKKQVELTQYTHKKSKIRSFLQCLPYISQLSVYFEDPDEEIRFFVNLFCAAAEREQQTGETILELLSSVCTYQTFPVNEKDMDDDNDDDDDDMKKRQCDHLLDLYSKVKDCETKTGLSVLPSLQSVFQSAPAVWSINLSERTTSILLEVLKLQPEKKQVELTQYTHKKSKIRSFLQCLPYISQLSVDSLGPRLHEAVRFFVNLFCAAAEREQQTGEKILELLSSVCRCHNFPYVNTNLTDYGKKCQSDFLLDLYSKVKDCESKTGLSVLPSLQSVFQSAPAVWSINLSERKTSILLEVLKLQPEKKQVELTQYTHKKSKIRSFLQCLPYISQLSVDTKTSDEDRTKFFVNLFCAAAEREQQTGEKILELLSSVCTYQTFPFNERCKDDDDDMKKRQCDHLLDLYSKVKDCEAKTGLSVLPSLQSVFQSAPAVWFINLSERKTSILLEVLKLQPEKKQVELTQYTHKKSKIRSFLQCLPYISQLSYSVYPDWTDPFEGARFFVNLFCAAAEREQQTGETILELLSSVCTYQTFPVNDIFINDCYRSDFLLDLYCHVKDYETKTGLSVLPSIQSVFQSAPAVWSINFIYTNFSILLEVLKLQSEKKQVELREWPEEEEEEDSVLRSFLQCLPYISQLSCDPDFFQSVCTSMSVRSREEAQQLKSLLQLLGFQLLLTGELHRKSCWSVGRVLKLCSSKVDLILTPSKMSARGAALLFRHTTQLHSLRQEVKS
uniref:NACHT domain-containing protein n=1 Tax=Oreochromis niloticus TaxID=8128 RepID=A0A669F9T3_ORENI